MKNHFCTEINYKTKFQGTTLIYVGVARTLEFLTAGIFEIPMVVN
jgi:hypothetical protein